MKDPDMKTKFLVTTPLLLLPTLLSGCMTATVIHTAGQEHTHFVHDRVTGVEKAAVLPDSTLVVWLDGKMADAAIPGKFMVRAPLSGSASLSAYGERDHGTVRRSTITEGWDPGGLDKDALPDSGA